MALWLKIKAMHLSLRNDSINKIQRKKTLSLRFDKNKLITIQFGKNGLTLCLCACVYVVRSITSLFLNFDDDDDDTEQSKVDRWHQPQLNKK